MNITKVLQKKSASVYFIGIKGVGMTMLAQFLAKKGYQVSGSDNPEKFLTDKVLRSAKIKVWQQFATKNIPKTVDLIVYSSAYTPGNNAEVALVLKSPRLAKKALVYAEALGQVFSHYHGLAVCGSHGKTTTSAWLGFVLQKAGLSPNVLVGSRVPQFKGSSLTGKSKYFVAEVDEYQNKLRYFFPQGVVLNNIDYDHPDFFKTEADYVNVFKEFVKRIPKKGFLVVNSDNDWAAQVAKSCPGKIISYSALVVENLRYQGSHQHFYIAGLGDFSISLLGRHNVANALAVIYTALELGVSVKKIQKYLGEFTGTERRLQVLGKYRGALIIDDYAHHPTEIKATLEGLRETYPKKNIITVFHPHTYTRTKALLNDFSQSFGDTNELIVLDIYGSAREKQGGVSSGDLVKKVIKYNQTLKKKQLVKHIPGLKAAEDYLKKKIKANDLVILMGAGDVFRMGEGMLKK
jgi:UDP-N-acetylmuramate--alanine ligase